MVTADRLYRQAFDGTLETHLKYGSREEYERNIPRDETTLFLSGKKRLVFIAGLHVSRRTRFVDFIDEVIKKTRPDAILLEIPSNFQKEYIKTAKPIKNEVGYAIGLADRYGADPIAMDLARNETFIPYLEHKDKDAIKAGIFIEIIRTYDGLQKYNSDIYVGFSKADFYDLAITSFIRNAYNGAYGDFKDTFVKLIGTYKGTIIEKVKQINKEASRKYVSKSLPMEQILEIRDLQAPYPFSELALGKIVRWQDAWRNKSMIDTCMKALRSNDKVVALAGSGHIYECRNLLAEEMKRKFGTVTVTRWKDL